MVAGNKIKNEFGGRHFTFDVILWAVRNRKSIYF